jgi:small-conductance mechanosensitive channel
MLHLDALRPANLENALWSLAILLAAVVLGRAVAWLVVRSLKRWAERTSTLADDALAEHLPEPLGWLLPALAVEWALPALPSKGAWIDAPRHVVLVVIIMAAGWTAFRGLRVVEDVVRARYERGDTLAARSAFTQLRAFRNVGGFAIVLLSLAFALMTFETVRNIGTGLLASAGVAGIVVGFAAQRTLSTVLAGVQIALAQPIRVDDIVIVEGEWGTIEEIALTYVVVRVWDLRRLVVPIHYFIEKPFQNWTRASANLLGTVELRLDYSVPVEEVRAELERVLGASAFWDKATAGVQVTEAGERTMLVRLLMSAKNADDLWNLRCEAREKLIAFVQRTRPNALPRLRAAIDGGVRAA